MNESTLITSKTASRWIRPLSLILALSSAHMSMAQEESTEAATRTFTPDMTWEVVETLSNTWGLRWSSSEAYDATQIVLTAIKYPPLKPEYLARSEAYVQRIWDGEAEFKQAACAPNGMTRSIWYTGGPTFLFQPGNRLLISAGGDVREVFMDGRPHPEDIDVDAAHIKYNGHSIGWWEGETLVVDTVGVNPGHELFYGVSYGGPSHILERYELLDENTLNITVTVDAPARLVEPWVFTKQVSTSPGPFGMSGGGSTVSTRGCYQSDSRQKVDADGNLFLDLTPPPPLK